MNKSDEPLKGSFTSEHVESAISYAIDHCSATSITYSDLFAAAELESPRWYFENGFRQVITHFMEAFHYACARKDLPPFDAFIVTASGERADYPGIGYFSVNGLSDPLNDHTSDTKAKAALSFHENQLTQIRAWCNGQH